MSAPTVTLPLDTFINILLGCHRHDECSNPLWGHCQKHDWISLKCPLPKEIKDLIPPSTEFSTYYIQSDKHGNHVLWEHRHWRDSNTRRLIQVEARNADMAEQESKTSNPRRIARIARAIAKAYGGIFNVSQLEATLMQAYTGAGEGFLKHTVSVYENHSPVKPATFYEPPVNISTEQQNESTNSTGIETQQDQKSDPGPEGQNPAPTPSHGRPTGASDPLAALLG